MLFHHGCFLSFGSAILQEKSHASASLFAAPAESFFLETDDSDLPIEAVYQRAAEIRGLDVRELDGLLERNYRRIL